MYGLVSYAFMMVSQLICISLCRMVLYSSWEILCCIIPYEQCYVVGSS